MLPIRRILLRYNHANMRQRCNQVRLRTDINSEREKKMYGRLALHIGVFFLSLFLSSGAFSEDSIGPFVIKSDDGNTSLQIKFAGQLKLEYKDLDRSPFKPEKSGLYSETHRLRLGFGGSIASPVITYRLQLSLAPRSLELMDIYVNYAYCPYLQFRYGQFKVPFTRYRMQSFQHLAFVDWSILTRYFGAERQIGFLFHNGYTKPNQLTYILGVCSGFNARASHAVGLPELFGRALPNPSNLSDPASRERVHPELFLHASYNSEDVSLEVDTDDIGGDIRYALGFSAAWDNDPTRYQDLKGRLAGEALLKSKGGSLFGAGYLGYVDNLWSNQTGLGLTGWQIQGAFRVRPWIEVSIRYAGVQLRKALTDYAVEFAQRTVAEAWDNYVMTPDDDNWELYQSALDQLSFSKLTDEEELTFGVNIYVVGHCLKWQNDYSRCVREFKDGDTRDFILRSQLQLAF